MLKRRGFQVLKSNPAKGLLVGEGFSKEGQDRLFNLMHHYGFRTFLKDVILHRDSFQLQDLTRYCSEESAQGYLQEILQMELIFSKGDGFYALHRANEVYSLGETLEWYLARLLREEWECDALYRVTLAHLPSGGDYDVLVECENKLIYIEVKSAPPKSVELENLRAFLLRIQDLGPHLSIFFEDTTLRMKDKIVPHCEKILKEEFGDRYEETVQFQRVENETFRWGDLFITNSKPGIIDNLRLCLSTYLRG